MSCHMTYIITKPNIYYFTLTNIMKIYIHFPVKKTVANQIVQTDPIGCLEIEECELTFLDKDLRYVNFWDAVILGGQAEVWYKAQLDGIMARITLRMREIRCWWNRAALNSNLDVCITIQSTMSRVLGKHIFFIEDEQRKDVAVQCDLVTLNDIIND